MKKILCAGLAITLILGSYSAAFAASAKTTYGAAETASTTTTSAQASADMSFTGTPIKLSLDGAYKKMLADSPGAKMAELNKQNNDGIAKGYTEAVQDLNKAAEYLASSKAIARLQKEFAVTQTPKNYEAEINKLKSDTFNNYYTLKNLEAQQKIAQENLALSEKLFSNTSLKFKLGTVSKNDVLQAEISVNKAKDQYQLATNGLNTMKMNFNQFMGYDLMQNVTLTDDITAVAMPAKSLKDSIASALTNRNEIAEANYQHGKAALNVEAYSAYPKSSSKYITAKIAMLSAETAKKNAPLTIEVDVRNKYMAVNQKYSAVSTGKKSVENAKESVRLAQLQYDSGMKTLSDVEAAQIEYYTVQQSYAEALLAYNLAVNDYLLCSGVGVTSVAL